LIPRRSSNSTIESDRGRGRFELPSGQAAHNTRVNIAAVIWSYLASAKIVYLSERATVSLQSRVEPERERTIRYFAFGGRRRQGGRAVLAARRKRRRRRRGRRPHRHRRSDAARCACSKAYIKNARRQSTCTFCRLPGPMHGPVPSRHSCSRYFFFRLTGPCLSPNAAGDHRAAVTELPLARRARGGALVPPTRTYNGTALGSSRLPSPRPSPPRPSQSFEPHLSAWGVCEYGRSFGEDFPLRVTARPGWGSVAP
jgi:hypothetical protein